VRPTVVGNKKIVIFSHNDMSIERHFIQMKFSGILTIETLSQLPRIMASTNQWSYEIGFLKKKPKTANCLPSAGSKLPRRTFVSKKKKSSKKYSY
jgi:hypothetical protein